MGEKIEITLTGPASVHGKWRQTGDRLAVSLDELEELTVAGVVKADGAALQQGSDVLEEHLQEALARAELAEKTVSDLTADLATEAKARAEAEQAQTLTQARIVEIEEMARKASVENIASIVGWLKTTENAQAVRGLSDAKAVKAVGDALGRAVSVSEYKTAVTALDLTK